ncbi:MAG: O-antigen ligase family protein, partial [Solirubrobacterales bacterium]
MKNRVAAHPSTAWIAVAIVAGVPLAFEPGGFFIFLPVKWALATVLVAAGLAALIFERRSLGRPPFLLPAWAALLAILVASSAFGIGGLTSWIGYPGRYLGVLAWVAFGGAFMLGASLREHADRALVVRAFSAASIVVSAYALFQEVEIDFVDWSEGIDTSRTRSTLGNAAFLGAYLAVVVPLAGRLASSRSEPTMWRCVHAAAAILGSVALLTTETRGAWVGAVVGIVVVAVLERRRLRELPTRTTALAGGAALLVVILLATVSPAAERIRSIPDPDAGTAEGRLLQWERTLDLIGDRPALGWGPDTYAFAFPPYIDAEFERDAGREVIPDRAHNLVLDLGATTGVLGLLAFLGVIGLIARFVARTPERDPLTVAVAGGCAAYLAQLQFGFSLADLDVVIWLLAGMLVATGAARSIPISRAWAAVPLVLALGLAVWGARELAADRSLRQALDAEANARFTEAQRLVDHAADLVPVRARYRQAAARLHRRVGEVSGEAAAFTLGLAAIDEARELLPRDLELAMDEADLHLSWGEAARDPGLIGRAAGGYEAILESDPASSRAHLKLGVAYVQLGRGDEAEREWLTAASLSPDSPGPLLNLGALYR